MYNDARVHRVNLSTVLSAQAFILAYEAAPLDELEAEEPDEPDLGQEGHKHSQQSAGPAAGGSQLPLYWTLALVGAIVAAIAGLAARKVLLS